MCFKDKILLCLLIMNNVIFTKGGYGFGHQMYGNRESNEQSDVGVPQHVPEIFKNMPGHFLPVKNFGVKTMKRPTFGGSEVHDLTSKETSSQIGNYRGGCLTRPETPSNARMSCSIYSGCRLTCIPDYQFADGKSSHIVVCTDGKWTVETWQVMPVCLPVCIMPCQHNGICVAPGQCNCPENFSGPQCQFEKKPCLNSPPLPMNSKRSCTSTSCTITCMKGHQFPDGSSITNLVCKEGNWIPTRSEMVGVPDCEPICEPPCLNGGNCLSLNTCQCPQDYRGPQCQFSSEACSVAKLGFNGGYNCSGKHDSIFCSLQCPSGIQFDSPPSAVYTCQYSSGVFLPQPIPQCIFGDHQVISMGGSSQTFYHSKQHSYGTSFKNPHSVKTGGIYDATDDYGFTNDSRHHFVDPNLYNQHLRAVELHKPKPGVCFTWGGAHFKTFDGKVFSFNSLCRHILVRDAQDNIFTVAIQNVDGRKRVSIFLQDKEYTLESNEEGGLVFLSGKRLLPIPAQLPGLRLQMAGHKVQAVLEATGLTLKWDGKQLVEIDATESLWKRTEGLCGKLDGSPDNDMATKEGIVPKSVVTLADNWKMNKVGEDICEDTPSEQHACSLESKITVEEAEKFCSDLVAKPRFAECSKIMDISLLLESCKWDYCGCPSQQSRQECGCDSLAVYAGQCSTQGIKSLAKWRDENTCMMNCTGGRVYQWCGPSIQPCCGSPTTPDANTPLSSTTSMEPGAVCTEGCFCPPGTLLHAGHCVTRDQCPCRLRGKQFPPGSSLPKDCNTCTCQDGEWTCTQVNCGARCSAIGDPHYQTFDGRRFDFMGQCSYYLIKGDDYSIEGENVACPGSISDAMNIPSSTRELFDMPSCTKTVTIRYEELTVQLKQGKVVVINGKDVNSLPTKVGKIRIRSVSSLFIQVKMPNGLLIWWDGITRVHIDAPPTLRGKTKGLCGTFNSNQKDDFLTPEGDVEQAVIPFANKWKTGEKCNDLANKEDVHPCESNIQNKPAAEKMCEKLKSKLFDECHWVVDVNPFYEDCMYDVCACDGPIERCLCPIIGAYASECARQGINIQWRLNIKECEIHCPGGQMYQVCGDSCARTCSDLATVWEDSMAADEAAHCKPSCVEGCNCPDGQVLDDLGECVSHSSCPCRHDSLTFPPMYKEVRPGAREQELCTCTGAKWHCKPATPEEIINYPRAADIKDKCSATRNEEFTPCEPAEPLTCKNMHKSPEGSSVAECRPGCQCKKGFVLDSIGKVCIKPNECPCHHGGRSYSDGETMQEDCNICKCNSGKWSCEKRVCAGTCSGWGDSHFKTFDGRTFDFQGVCTYLLTKGCLDTPDEGFSVEIQNEVCGTSGVTCSKAVTLKVGAPSDAESVTFTKDKPLPNVKTLKKIKLRHAGLFVFAEVPSLGLTVQWDRGTRVYVRADPKWQGRLRGLCGNYNNNEEDDFQTPSGGVSEASARLFGDSWKLQPTCPLASEIQDTCALHPERHPWSVKRCSAMKRYPFTACHSEVPPGEYISRCERDTCACGLGGDCDCLCTALAAYVHECASHGVPIKWRSQELCPMQCDETCSKYSPCISTCPVETCDTTLFYTQLTEMCPQDTCVEGCQPHKKCGKDEVMSNSSLEVCVPRATCKPECLTLPGGRKVLEGEVMEQDECHSCHCSRGTKICKGEPCTTLPPGSTTPSSVHLMEQKSKCQSGWSEWISQSVPQETKDAKATKQFTKTFKSTKIYSVENEPLPTLLQLNNMKGGFCTSDKIADIECRTVAGHQTPKQTGLDAECSLEQGLFCRQLKDRPCPDFEIRVKCQCEEETPAPETTPSLLPEVCIFKIPKAHETDCHLFYECAPGMGTPEHPDIVTKSCGDDMLFNPHTLTCDWPDAVISFKPECQEISTTVEGAGKYLLATPETSGKYVKVMPTMPSPHWVCDAMRPNQEHESDCKLFYHCAVGMGPPDHPNVVVKSCGPHMMYNPESMVCDWPQLVMALKPSCGVAPSVHPTVGTTISFEEVTSEGSPCEYGKVWSECAVNCKQLCKYYEFYLLKEGKCVNGEKCIPGCIDESVAKKKCEKDFLWRDAATCVAEADCTCHTYYGKPVKPGQVVKESECDICQCLHNQYVCDSSACSTKAPEHNQKLIKKLMKPPPSRETETSAVDYEEEDEGRSYFKNIHILKSTLSPPPECSPERYTDIMWGDQPLPDEAFSASSSLSSSFEPQFAKLNGKATEISGGNWAPSESVPDEYIQVNLDRPQPVYGIVMQGSPLYDQYVTSYNVMHSDNGLFYLYVKGPDDKPQVFRGPIDNETPLKQMFSIPFEARYVRVLPQTWHNGIAVRLELIGCGNITTTLPPTTTTPAPPKKKVPICAKPEKLAALPIETVDLSTDKNNHHNPHDIKQWQTDYWEPLVYSPKEWIQFDFGEAKKITGVITTGGPDGYVTSYTLSYSNDATNWSPVMDNLMQVVKFPGNFDNNTPFNNSFEVPIHARYLRVSPNKWKHKVQMKIEPQGCFELMEKEEIPEVGPEVDFEECELCNGIKTPEQGCNCEDLMAFDGNQCVPRVECPCIVGYIPYSVGATYMTENCETCICTLGGVPSCEKKDCPKCDNGLVRNISKSCECECVPCPKGQVICPTSEVCIPETSWCDGLQDCPDDETNCITTTLPTTTEVAEVKEIQCPVPTCPKGYKVVEKKTTYKNLELQNSELTSDSLFAQPSNSGRKGYMKYFKGGTKGGTKSSYGGLKTSYTPVKAALPMPKPNKPVDGDQSTKKECVEWRCVSSRPPPPLVSKGPKPSVPPCPAPHCPKDYTITMENDVLDEYDCPKYACSPPPRRDAVCNVTCRIFNTFDGTEFQYDICNHILARDAERNTWDVTIQKNCTKDVCVNELLISQELDQVRFRPDLTVEYNGYQYTVDQTRKIGFQTQTFAISRLGDTLFYISTKYGFWVMYDNKRNTKIGVAGKLYGRVDGLCGFFNEDASDDRRKPDGTPAISTEDFGDSWAHTESPEVCEVRACPIYLQTEALKMCKTLSSKTFSICNSSMDMEQSRARCLESVCECMQGSVAKEKGDNACLCEALQAFVTSCEAADRSVDLQGWRVDINCPVSCPSSLVHYDCYRRSCEVSCGMLQEENPCRPTPGVCFSGCFCPSGMVKKGDECVPPTECRDCVCDGYGKPQFVTFDRRNYTFNGNCTYIAARDKDKSGRHLFEVYVTNGECPHDSLAVCTVALHIVYGDHILHIQKQENELEVIIDGMKVRHFPEKNNWLYLIQTSGQDISLLISAIQLEVSSIFHNMAFTIRIPSILYSNKTEGLCGDCDGDPYNDIGTSDEAVRKFGLSWRAPLEQLADLNIHEENCMEKPKGECWPLPPDKDPCFKIMDEVKFGKCHPVVDPVPFLVSCQQDMCAISHQQGLCISLEAYARECTRAGICLNWRRDDLCPFSCNDGFEYDPCGTGCQITCQNYFELTKNPSSCIMPPTEGCFCPKGKVAVNEKCIPHHKCFPCDNNGHYYGDNWRVDECTMCTCKEGGGVLCGEKSCLEMFTCPVGQVAREIAKPPGECCPNFVCVPEATKGPEICDKPIKIDCGFGQVMVLDVSGPCPHFVCKCKPLDECDPVPTETKPLEPGMERVVDSSGCCPQVQLVCHPNTCPEPPKCPPHHTAKPHQKENQCCPHYICEPPPDMCLYDMEYEASPLGGQLKKPSDQVEAVVKSIGSTWMDGPCQVCSCKKPSSSSSNAKLTPTMKERPKAVCTVIQCSKLPESEDFIIEFVGVPLACCPESKYTACKHKGKIYKIGEEWKSHSNSCISYVCASKNDGTLEKRTRVKQCETNCKQGWKYTPSPTPGKVCCGECVPVACVVAGVERKIGEKWTSDDFCTSYSCLNKNGSLQVKSLGETCPEVPKTTQENFVLEEIPVKGQCCKKTKIIACKVNGEVYKEGSTWPSSDGNPCKNQTCTRDTHNELVKTESIENCMTDCAPGWEYTPPNDPHICCGQCLQVACVIEEVLYKPGQTWKSEDKCTQFHCDQQGEQLVVAAQQESCPDVSGCDPRTIYLKGCCKHCNITSSAQKNCMTEELPQEKTIALVHQLRDNHGNCENTKPLSGFKECRGTCSSGTIYNEELSMHDTECKCCQATKYDAIIVELTCEDNYVFKKQIAVPSACECMACISELSKSKSTKSGRKIPGLRSGRVAFASNPDDDVEVFDPDTL